MTTLNDNKVALSIVVDRSGSMELMNPKEICGSLNSLIADQVATGKEILVWFSTFDDKYETPHRGVPGKNVSITTTSVCIVMKYQMKQLYNVYITSTRFNL